MTAFFRFPHTPHLAWLGRDTPRDGKVMSAAEAVHYLAQVVVIEEKLDGANLGLSIGSDGSVRAQNRGQYLARPFTGQFARLNGWLAKHEEALFDALSKNLMLFGEWAAAVHTLEYPGLPDYFLVFDVYDKQLQRFWSTKRRNELAARLGLQHVYQIGIGRYRLATLQQMLTSIQSNYRSGASEGIYIRYECEDWLIARAKLVHPSFVQGIGGHWRSRSLRWNALNIGNASSQ